MLTLLSPAKSLDTETPIRTKKASEPRWMDESAALVELMATKSPDELMGMMGISADLAGLNHERFADWDVDPPRQATRQALFMFDGDVYRGLDAWTLGERDLTFAQRNLRILSGLHGVLRPLDLIQPYRLEMGSRLPNGRGADLYAFWSKLVTESLNEDLDGRSPAVVVNLASQEYSRVVDADALNGRLVSPVFLDFKNGTFKVISFFAKRARGAMAGWIVRNRIRTISGLRDFDVDGYSYDPDRSTADAPTYVRAGR